MDREFNYMLCMQTFWGTLTVEHACVNEETALHGRRRRRGEAAGDSRGALQSGPWK